MRKIFPTIFYIFSSLALLAQASGGWGTCEFTTVAAMNAFDPSVSNFSCKKVYVQATDEHYRWNGTAWVLESADVENIYTADGTLAGNRTVTMSTFNLEMDMTSTGDFNVLDNGTPAFSVRDDGQVGIGTASPDAKLDVEGGSVRFTDYGTGTYTGTEAYYLGVEADGDIVEVAIPGGSGSSIYSANGTLAGDRTVTMDGNDLTFDGTSDIILQDDGKIGIGTTSPAEELDVRGTIVGALPCVAVAMCTENHDESDNDVMGLMVASVPSTNKIYVKSIQNAGGTSADELQAESNWTNGAAGAWNDFGDPSGGAAGYIMDVSVSIEFGGSRNEDDFGGVITVRWSDGTIYVLSTDNNTLNDNAIDDLTNWGASWDSWNGPGM